MKKDFDVIVIGGGHAGVEAAYACYRLGKKTLLISNNLKRTSYMSCNPSIGGLAKGHMVREIDVLGGLMGQAADASCVQFKKLNSKRGPAVRGSRAQCDKDLYSSFVFSYLKKYTDISFLEDEVLKILISSYKAEGIETKKGLKISSHTVILSAGTFMRGVMHVGLKKKSGGRVGDKASFSLSEQFEDLNFKLTRLKTGTPPRLFKDSINWSCLKAEYGDSEFVPFSFKTKKQSLSKTLPCYLTYTNEKTHKIIRSHLDQSPIYSGDITGTGPRYCPSIEDKVVRFCEKNRHQSFLEPEGFNSDLIYLQGISTSLPEEVQYQFLKTIKALENVKIARPGYAVEYDFFDSFQIKENLETKKIKSLFLAGQINGTSGYEEAAAQGLMAGVNASLQIDEKESFILKRHEAYIGVLIDDLITKGTKEPYRMMTSRAEHRLVLREDNVTERLLDISHSLNLINDKEFEKLSYFLEKQEKLTQSLKEIKINPESMEEKSIFQKNSILKKPQSLFEILKRPEIEMKHFLDLSQFKEKDSKILTPVEVKIKYQGYIDREKRLIEQIKKQFLIKIPSSIDYQKVVGLSLEEKEKLHQIRPLNLAQASRISGVNPSALQALMVHIKAF